MSLRDFELYNIFIYSFVNLIDSYKKISIPIIYYYLLLKYSSWQKINNYKAQF